MTLGEELCKKYALTSLRAKGGKSAQLAINEALEAAAEIADRENSPLIAWRIRTLKWVDHAMAKVPVEAFQHFPEAA